MGTLTSKTPGTPDFTYLGLLHLEANTEITSLLQKIQDGGGNDTGLEISTTALKYTGNLTLASLTASTLVYLDSNKKLVSLAAGSAGDVLTLAGGVPTWAAPATGITIDTTPITGGGSGRILFESATGKVSEDSNFTFISEQLKVGVLRIQAAGSPTKNSVWIGKDITPSTVQYAVVIGQQGDAQTAGIAIGYQAYGNQQTVSIGTQTGLYAGGGRGSVNIGNTVASHAAYNADRNVIIGYISGDNISTGSYNTILGANTGQGVTTGTKNTIIGANVTGLTSGLTANIIIADGDGNLRYHHDGTYYYNYYNNTNYEKKSIGSTGVVTYDAVGSGASFVFAKQLKSDTISGNIFAYASIPSPVAKGMITTITDSNTTTPGAIIAGGGANSVLAWYNGTNWIVVV